MRATTLKAHLIKALSIFFIVCFVIGICPASARVIRPDHLKNGQIGSNKLSPDKVTRPRNTGFISLPGSPERGTQIETNKFR